MLHGGKASVEEAGTGQFLDIRDEVRPQASQGIEFFVDEELKGSVETLCSYQFGVGVGRGVLHKLIEIAGDKGLKKLMFEVIAKTEEAARHTAQVLGFVPVAVLPGHVLDVRGNPHDLLIMERRLLDPGLSADGEVKDYVPVF